MLPDAKQGDRGPNFVERWPGKDGTRHAQLHPLHRTSMRVDWCIGDIHIRPGNHTDVDRAVGPLGGDNHVADSDLEGEPVEGASLNGDSTGFGVGIGGLLGEF